MKKLLVMLSIILFVVTSMAAFRDIPKGHWAESYVSRLEQIGIVTGFPDGTYRGDEAITRYQSALLISRTLDYVELILKDKQSQIDSLLQQVRRLQSTIDKNSSDFDAKLQNLANQLQDVRNTLNLSGNDIANLYKSVAQLQNKFIYTDEEGSTSEIDLSQLKNDVAGLSEILSGLATQLGDVDYVLRKQIADLDKKTSAKDEELSNSLSIVSQKIDELASQLEKVQAKIDDINENIANVYSTLSDAILSLQEELATLTARLDELETRILNMESTISTGLPAIRDMVYGLSEDLANTKESMKAYTDVVADEIKAELEASLNNVSAELQDMRLTLELHDQDIIKIYDLVTQLQDKFIYTDEEGSTSEIDLSQLKNDVAGLSEILSGLAAQLGDVDYLLRKQIADLDKKTSAKDEELTNSVATLSEKTDSLTSQLEMLQAKIDDTNENIANVYSTLSDGILSVQENLTTLEGELTARLDELETRILNIESTLETGLPAIRDMVYGLSEDLANAQQSMKAYTDVVADEIRATLEASLNDIATELQQMKLTLELHDQDIIKLYDFITQLQTDIAELRELIADQETPNNEKFNDVYETIEQQTAILSDAIMGQQEELAQLHEKLDKLNDFVVNFKNEVSEKLENLDMRLSLLEDQVASLTQVVEEVKADKADVEELANKLTEVEKSSATKKELEEARTITTWGVFTGVSGIVIGIIALGKVLGWF